MGGSTRRLARPHVLERDSAEVEEAADRPRLDPDRQYGADVPVLPTCLQKHPEARRVDEGDVTEIEGHGTPARPPQLVERPGEAVDRRQVEFTAHLDHDALGPPVDACREW